METRKLRGLAVPPRVVLILLIVLPIVGFLIGNLGGSGGNTTGSVNATVTPQKIGLAPGQSRPFTIVVTNPNDYGVRVASISAGSSQAAGDCPAGVLTSEEVSNPTGYIQPHGLNAYAVTLNLAGNADHRCLRQSLTVPLTVKLAGD
ncbi:MAG TPA: hypothetical protein VFQ77_01150 [Pseudonocardiaceae bacterium]|nr:hypothetical protein [Pseudonocardiaceae bacterium]